MVFQERDDTVPVAEIDHIVHHGRCACDPTASVEPPVPQWTRRVRVTFLRPAIQDRAQWHRASRTMSKRSIAAVHFLLEQDRSEHSGRK